MPRRKLEPYPFPDDWLEEMVKRIWDAKAKGGKPILSELPAILPERWKRVDKDYEELLIAMLANGYSKAQIQRTLKKLALPYSEESLEDILEFIREKT